MTSMIDELWYGNVSPMDDTRNNTEEMKELMSYIARHQEELIATLTDEQKAIFEKFDDCLSEYASKAQKAIFSYAFKLGARLVLEILTD
ncbi:MAG: hypothetical protein IJA82_03100 [Clostridia bacterium]|nr:hypothetical protein [Clostridia bacterium]